MKKLLVVLSIAIALYAIKAYACYTETLIIDGRVINCTVCGDVTNCY